MKKTKNLLEMRAILCAPAAAILLSVPLLASAANYTNHTDIQFVGLPKGKFFMGSCGGDVFLNREVTFSGKIGKLRQSAGSMLCRCDSLPDPEAKSDEFPQHEVTISRNVQISRYEITVGQFMRFIREAGREDFLSDAGFSANNNQGDDFPVTNVSWADAVDFARWLNASKPRSDSGLYRLPTEAEWEYAARAKKHSHYYFGNDPADLDQFALSIYNSSGGPSAVGSLSPNRWKLFDMSGNVWEWVFDWYGPYDGDTPSNNPIGAKNGEKRVLRGGSWKSEAPGLRSAARAAADPGLRASHVGFRLVREIRGK